MARARAAFERAVALEPEHGIALGNLAIAEFAARRFEEAGRWSDSALAVTPGSSGLQVNSAMIRLVLGDTAGARASAQASLRLAERPWARGIIALIALRRGDTLARDSPSSRRRRPWCHSRRPRRTIGERAIERAHWPGRANGDGDAIPRTSLGGPDGGLAAGG